MQTISIVLADAQYLIRLGLRHLLSGSAIFRIAGEAKDEAELMELLATSRPRVAILDYNQPGAFSIHTVKRIRAAHPETHLLVISADESKEHIFQILELGVNSFLTKSCDEQEIIDAINASARGEKFFCTKILDYLLERTFSKGPESSCAATPLTAREIEVVKLIARGLIAKEIAGELNLSPHTIYTHRKKIMKKLQLNSASELVLYAVHTGLIKADAVALQSF
ncbi:MAG: response regulator transcription factor [Lewinellaceae bacterium]|nr:response regulator transcription factor [Lewinellaceae bacterium]